MSKHALTSIIYDGRNTAEVRTWVDKQGTPAGETWFMTRSQAAPTGLQAWRYVKDGRPWGEDVLAAVYDETLDAWLPVRRGDTIQRLGRGGEGAWQVIPA